MTVELVRTWELASPEVARDPARYLGELRELPPVESRETGDWCDLIVHDELGEMRYSLVVTDAASRGAVGDDVVDAVA